ncbi:MAG TPA: NAD(+) synthase [Polyangiaceae bacterium]|nr:NAD(+) synthase [Polyangiaceae bacterium]
MKLLRVAAATLNQTPLDWDGNRAHILSAIEEARAEGVSVLCLPELCISGYGCEDAFLAPGTQAMALSLLEEILPYARGLLVSVGLPLFHNKALYNACALIADGKLCGFVAKRALSGDGIHYEPRWFKPWPAGTRTSISLFGQDVPLGDIFFECSGVRIGFEICEDAWVAQRRGAELALTGVDLILNPSASHFAFGKQEVRRRLVLEGSRAFGVSYVYANLVGNEAGRAIYDGDALIATAGKLIAQAQRFGFADHALVSGVIDVDLTRVRHASLSSSQPSVESAPDECVPVKFAFPTLEVFDPDPGVPEWEGSAALKEEEFARAIALGLFDYCRKSRSRGFVVSLSGGADSAAVACLVSLMVRFSVRELGLDGFALKFEHLEGLSRLSSERELISALLTTAYQATRNSSNVTREAAARVASALGATHLEFDVEALVAGYVSAVEAALGRKLEWQRDDLALQNIQARVRAPSVWLLANLNSALLLSTSNRSEAAVGYATMDGDTAGGLSPIAGIDKAFLRRFLVWLEKVGPHEFGPIPELDAVNVQAPTAELRPPSATQTDEADLMPYEVLDAIERAAIRDKRSPREVLSLICAEFSQYSKEDLWLWLDRFFRLWSRNQWKRERYAPSFHVDDESLDPKTWCRFPILSGGFIRELRELRQALAREKS